MSNELISKSVKNRLAMLGDGDMCVEANEVGKEMEMRTTKFDEIIKLKEEIRNITERLDTAVHIIESNDRRHDEDMGYIEHYRQRIAELEQLLRRNNIEVP